MKVIGERIIAYLKTDATLVALLGGAYVMAQGVQELDKRKQKYVTVSINPGESGNNLPSQTGSVLIEIAVSRKVPNAFASCMDILSRVDDILNKCEDDLTATGFNIIHFLRATSPSAGVAVDDKTNEFFVEMEYEYILCEEDAIT